MGPNVLFRLPTALITFIASTIAVELPYNPTTLLKSRTDDSLLYAFRYSSSTSNQLELAYINTSQSINSADIQYNTLTSSLPFKDDNLQKSIIPTIARDGTITVIAGNCSTRDGLELWNYAPNSDPTREGIWSQSSVKSGASFTTGTAGFLSSGISFASRLQGDKFLSSTYILGGMCPFENSTSESWQSTAGYSNIMLSVDPGTGDSTGTYSTDSVSSREPLIAQAGYAIATLSATYSNSTEGMQTQQQDFVILGGQTQTAWINMSRIALFSLPQESFSYIDVEEPDSQRTDLAVRTDITEVQPRSGHTAVLSEDGSSIIVFGGWVGDVSNPAEPQLAVLKLGSDYGGQGAWKWVAPTSSGTVPLNGKGLYGHGATLLSGNVLMISGGYEIGSISSKNRRQSTQSSNSQTFFYNITSSSWTSGYVPSTATDSSSDQDNDGPLSSSAQRAGLGVGLVFGILAVIGLVGFFFWYKRRLQTRRDQREKELRGLAQTAHRVDQMSYGDGGLDGRGADPTAAYYFSTGDDPRNPGWKTRQGHDAERTGLLLDIPSPTRGLRRGLAARPVAYADGRLPLSAGHIHPIDELEEEEEEEERFNEKSTKGKAPLSKDMAERGSPSSRLALMSGGMNPLGSHPVSDHSPIRKHRYSGSQSSIDWTIEMEQKASGVFFGQDSSSSSSGGRLSPTKSERTVSNLSDRSIMSNFSARSISQYSNTISRNLSLRSSTLLNSFADPFTTPENSPTGEQHADRHSRARPSSAHESERSDSFATAKSSFVALQAEGQALLGGLPGHARNANSPREHDDEDEEFEFGRRERSRSLLGHVRAAFTRTLTRTVSGSRRPHTMVQRSASGSNRRDVFVDAPDGSRTVHTSHPASAPSLLPGSATPRRTASDASHWRSKRGAKDWDTDPYPSPSSELPFNWRRNSGDDWGSPEDQERREREQEKEWDVEGAAENRDVQVTFTVPRRRLRVVNAPSMRSLSVSTREDEGVARKSEEDEPIAGVETVGEKNEDAEVRAGMKHAQLTEKRSRVEELRGLFENPRD